MSLHMKEMTHKLHDMKQDKEDKRPPPAGLSVFYLAWLERNVLKLLYVLQNNRVVTDHQGKNIETMKKQDGSPVKL